MKQKRSVAIGLSLLLATGSILSPWAVQGAATKTAPALKSGAYTKGKILPRQKLTVGKASCGRVSYTVSTVKGSFYRKGGKTYLTTRTTWSWSKPPNCLFRDIAAMTTSEHFAKVSASARVTYYLWGKRSGASKTYRPKVLTKDSGRGTYCQFPMRKVWAKNRNAQAYYAMEGTMTTKWRINGNVRCVGISANYGHTLINVSPSVSFSAGGGSISFRPAKSVSYGSEAYRNISRK